MTERDMLVYGALGSLLPEALRWKNLVTQDVTIAPPMPSWAYVVVTFVFVGIGAFFTLAYRPESRIKAVYIGAGWPAILSAASTAVPKI